MIDKAVILSTGNELTGGRVADTNSTILPIGYPSGQRRRVPPGKAADHAAVLPPLRPPGYIDSRYSPRIRHTSIADKIPASFP